jgi:hypothetical protein
MTMCVPKASKTVACALLALGAASCDVAPDQQIHDDPQAKSSIKFPDLPNCHWEVSCVFEGVQKAYDIYGKVKDFLTGAPDLVDVIAAAQAQIIGELHRMRRDELGAAFSAMVDEYGEIARNPHHPATRQRLNNWMTASLSLFSQLETAISHATVGVEGDALEDAYAFAPAFNSVGALRVSVMNGIPELDFPAIDAHSISEMFRKLQVTNYRLVGAQRGQSDDYGSVEPFWGSVFWRSSKFGNATYQCDQSHTCVDLDDAGRSWRTAILCKAISGCEWDCGTNNYESGNMSSTCYGSTASQAKADFLADPVISVIRFGLARATQNYSFRIWDGNWGWLTIIEA